MDLHHKREIAVGTFVLAGIAFFLGGTMWLRGRSFSNAPEVKIVFPDVGTLKRGAAVRVSGVALGSVERIEFQRVGQVLVTASISKQVQPRIDATAKLATVGLVADAIIVFNPGTQTALLPADKVIQGTIEQGLTDLGADLGGQAKQVLSGIQEIANKRLADDLHQTLAVLQKTLAIYANQQSGPSAELPEALRAIQRVGARLDTLLQRTDLLPTLGRIDTLSARLAATSSQFTSTGAQLDSLLRRINSGQGSLGKLMTDSLLYGDLRRMTKSIQSLVDTLAKNPGKLTIQVKVF